MKKVILLVYFTSLLITHSIQAKQKNTPKLDLRPILSSKNIDSATLNVKYKILKDDLFKAIVDAEKIENIKIKGEFETSLEYSSREKSIKSDMHSFLNSVFLLESNTTNPSFYKHRKIYYSEYNPDTEILTTTFNIDLEETDTFPQYYFNYIPISGESILKDIYNAQNAFGVKAEVKEYVRFKNNISLVPSINYNKDFHVKSHIKRDLAQKIKEDIEFLFLVSPAMSDKKLLFYSKEEFDNPTIDWPYKKHTYKSFLFTKLIKIITYNKKTGEILFITDFDKKEALASKEPLKDSYLNQ